MAGGNASRAAASAPPNASVRRFKNEHWDLMCRLIRGQGNFEHLHGGRQKTTVGKEGNQTKRVIYGEMARFVNSKAQVRIPNLDHDSMRHR